MDVTLEVDKFGRVLLPKKLREALRIGPGGKLRAHLDGGRMTVTPEAEATRLREENGLLLIEPSGPFPADSDPVADIRAARDRELLGEW